LIDADPIGRSVMVGDAKEMTAGRSR